MIPAKQHETWRALVTGKMKHQFKSVPAGLMLARIGRDYARAPGNLGALVDELHAFFVKYEAVLEDDIQQVFK